MSRHASEVATGTPVASSVLVVVPSRITPSYALVHAAAKGASRVARPTTTPSQPDARVAHVAGEKLGHGLADHLGYALGAVARSSHHVKKSSCSCPRSGRRRRPPPAGPPPAARSRRAGGPSPQRTPSARRAATGHGGPSPRPRR